MGGDGLGVLAGTVDSPSTRERVRVSGSTSECEAGDIEVPARARVTDPDGFTYDSDGATATVRLDCTS